VSSLGQVSSAAVLLPDMIGTTVCALPAVEAIRAALPSATVRLLGYARVTELLRDEPAAAQGLRLMDLARLGDELRAAFAEDGVPELVFDLLSTPLSETALAAAGVLHRVGWPSEDLGAPGHTIAVPYPGGRSQQSVQDYLDFVLAAGLPAPFRPPRLTAVSPTLEAARRWLDEQGVDDGPRFVLGLGGGNDRKRWPLPRYLELGVWLERHGAGRPVFFAGPREAEIVAQLHEALPAALVAQSLPLDLAKGLIAGCHLAVCNDHAIMHLSAALGVPTVGVFMASDPAEWFPYPAPSTHVIGPPLDCRPCFAEDCDGWACNDPSLMEQVQQRCAEILTG
jgi:ADP-heptose:LPS heptosyltransferase